ncbi:MAG TPA: hypothetical protein VK174_17830, partial [Chitinophagales bacterium]|nr:hypothetical protein [Chitinophagales bacterium]
MQPKPGISSHFIHIPLTYQSDLSYSNQLSMDTSDIKILIVDDEPDILAFLRYNLEKEGYWVYSATNGNDALKMALK